MAGQLRSMGDLIVTMENCNDGESVVTIHAMAGEHSSRRSVRRASSKHDFVS
jgi:hypothetical protein